MTLGAPGLRARVRVGIVLHAGVNLVFGGVALATQVPITLPTALAATPGLASSPAAVRAAVASEAVVVDLRPPTRHTRAPTRTVTSTGYCLEGITASGEPVGAGHAAMNDVPLGTRLRLLGGPLSGAVVEVTDRIGHGTELDLWFDRCDDAIDYGRRTIEIIEIIEIH